MPDHLVGQSSQQSRPPQNIHKHNVEADHRGSPIDQNPEDLQKVCPSYGPSPKETADPSRVDVPDPVASP